MIRAAIVTLGALVAMGGAASAQLTPKVGDGPIDITGDRLEVDGDLATWTGSVRAVQGEAILTADKIVADLAEDRSFKTIRAIGSVRYSSGEDAITGKEGVYDATARTITISDDVVVMQGKQVMTGGELVYWVDTGKLLFTAPSGRRIRGIFYAKGTDARS